MPPEWQERFVQCLEELDETFDWRPKDGRYWVTLKDHKGRYRHDPLMQYRHPDRAYIESLREGSRARRRIRWYEAVYVGLWLRWQRVKTWWKNLEPFIIE